MQIIFKMVSKEINNLLKDDIRFLFLIGLLFFLPTLEVPKNIFSFLLVTSWVVIAKKNNDWGGKWLIIDTIFLLWIFASIFVSINAVVVYQFSGGGYTDIMRFVLIAWVLSRTIFSKEKLVQLALIALIAVLISLIFSYYEGHGELKGLNSVGHINHTAMYLVITYAISLALLLFNFDNLNVYQKITLVISALVLFFVIIDTGSVAAFGLLIIITLFDFFYILIRVKNLSLFLIFFAVSTCIIISLMINTPWVIQKYLNKQQFLGDAGRDRINEFSYYAYKTNPIFGIGFKNYGKIKMNDIKDAVLEDKEVFDSDLYFSASHAHNIYFTYLISGGLLIFSIFMWFWFYIFWVLIKLITIRENQWIVFSSINVVLVNLGIGWFNTTFHHENAILSMFVLGLLIAQFRKSELIK